MAAPQNGEPLRIIGSIFKFAGTLVGTAVIAGKQIIHSTTPPSGGPSDKSKEKTSQTRSQRKKKAVRKTKKKKAVKRKPAGSSGKSGASKKKPAQSPAKKKKGATPREKTTRRTTKKTAKSEVSSHSQDGLTSETGAGTNAPIEKQKLSIPIVEYNDKANKAVVPTISVL